jgi:predicted nucleotidyltransferase component of viral defense system
MDPRFPTDASEIAEWSRRFGLPQRAARLRFAQMVMLESLAAHGLAVQLAFKGGNALRLVYDNPRGTIDLDFTARPSVRDDLDWIRARVGEAVAAIPADRRFKARVQSIQRRPAAEDATLPTYSIRVGFCLAGDRAFERGAFDRGEPVPEVVDLEISLNDVVCATEPVRLRPGHGGPIQVCTLEDIIAEKLRSLLQQPVRKRFRRQDAYDVARMWRVRGASMNLGLIAAFFRQKCAARGIPPLASAFDEEIRRRAAYEYGTLWDATGDAFIEFDDAWAGVMDLVGRLGLDG